jgi:hypothetical protein
MKIMTIPSAGRVLVSPSLALEGGSGGDVGANGIVGVADGVIVSLGLGDFVYFGSSVGIGVLVEVGGMAAVGVSIMAPPHATNPKAISIMNRILKLNIAHSLIDTVFYAFS